MENCDRVSELPESLIFEIFWYLPFREVVRSSILSKRWEKLWSSCPRLNFEDWGSECGAYRVRKFVNRALRKWSGTRIQQFGICLGNVNGKSLYDDIDSWLRFAIAKEHQLQDLSLNLRYIRGVDPIEGVREDFYWLPRSLYSCPTLQTLTLKGCNLHVPNPNIVSWYQLKHLTFQVYEVSEDLIDRVMSGCPRLEFFSLHHVESHHNLCIRSTSLKSLYICKYLHIRQDNVAPSTDTELRISTPNLQLLHIFGIPHAKFSMNAPSLTRANLVFDQPYRYRNHNLLCAQITAGTFKHILPTIQHVQQLALSESCIKALVSMRNINYMVNVNFLEVRHCYNQEILVHLLVMFPKLERLVVKHEIFPKAKLCENASVRFEANLPDSLLKQLRTIMIVWGEKDDDFIFPFIQILLKYATKLENMEFQLLVDTASSNNLILALKKLLPHLPNSSFSLNHSHLLNIFFQSSHNPIVD